MPMFTYNAWVDEETFMDEMAKLHKLNPKLDVIDVLWHECNELKSDPNYKSYLPGEGRKWLLAELSGQIVALSLELSDDLAAVCSAYLESVAEKNKLVIEKIAKWKTGKGHAFYDSVANNAKKATQAVGLDDTSVTSSEQEELRQRFVRIKYMRTKFWKWYTGYKHGQYATPIALIVTKEDATQAQEWGLYLVPCPLKRDSKGKIHTEDRFINTVDNVDLFRNLAMECVSLSIQTRDRQYPKVFGHSLS
ncbi:MAG: hypothetical protein ABSE39_02895 [Candidatus Bathyarchaeia archaeon]